MMYLATNPAVPFTAIHDDVQMVSCSQHGFIVPSSGIAVQDLYYDSAVDRDGNKSHLQRKFKDNCQNCNVLAHTTHKHTHTQTRSIHTGYGCNYVCA